MLGRFIKTLIDLGSKIFRPALGLSRKMDLKGSGKRRHDEVEKDAMEERDAKRSANTDACGGESIESLIAIIRKEKGKPIPDMVLNKMSIEELDLLANVKSSCTDFERIMAAMAVRIKYRLSVRVPEDLQDSSYYFDSGLRRVYPYPYMYQSYAKRRWIGRKLRDVLRDEFRDISEELLKWRFDNNKVIVNGSKVDFNHVLRDNDCVANRVHRHELPVLATPIKIIHQDKETLVINKPPSVPIHACGRYRHNSVINILSKEYNFHNVKVVHRLDRLVSGVLIVALNSRRANYFESSIKNRQVQKEYVCRVAGEFPSGDPENDGWITVDEPLEILPGKIGISVVLKSGKDSVTRFKRLSSNGKTSAVLCQPKTGRMHQIRVHLQYLGHPIVNDNLYNCASFGPERGKGGNYGGKSLQQLSQAVISMHRAHSWLVSEETDVLSPIDECQDDLLEKQLQDAKPLDQKVVQFLSDDEREETMAALSNFFTDQSCKELEQKYKYDSKKHIIDTSCRDCVDKFHDPPMRSLFLYLHALKYSGEGWSYETELPSWAQESWTY